MATKATISARRMEFSLTSHWYIFDEWFYLQINVLIFILSNDTHITFKFNCHTCVCTVYTAHTDTYPPKCYHIRVCLIKHWACKMNIKFIRETKLNIIISIHQWFCHFRTAFLHLLLCAVPFMSFVFVCSFLCWFVCLCWGARLFSTPNTTNPNYLFFFIRSRINYISGVCLSCCTICSFSIYDLLCVVCVPLVQCCRPPTPTQLRERERVMWMLFYLDSCWCWHKIQFNCKCLDKLFERMCEC